MDPRPLLAVIALLAFGTTHAQTGRWTIDSDFDLYSFAGLGSISTAATQHPSDLDAADALLVIGCDPNAPLGFEVTAWVAPLTTYVFDGPGALDDVDVATLVRFDQGPVLRQIWFLAEGYFQAEAVAYYDLNAALLEGLAAASTMALRIEGDPSRDLSERTFQYDVRGFTSALEQLRCGADGAEPEPPFDPFADAPDPSDDVERVGDWTFDGEAGIVAQSDEGSVALYCAADANGVEIAVGDYALTGATFDVGFRSGSIDFLRATATLNDFRAAQLDGDDVEDRLVRFLRGVVDLTVRIDPTTGPGSGMTFTVPTVGFNDALKRLGCYRGGR